MKNALHCMQYISLKISPPALRGNYIYGILLLYTVPYTISQLGRPQRGAAYRIYRNPLPSSTVLSNTDELVVTEQQNEGTTKERKQDTSSGILRPCVFGIIADRFLSPSVAQRCCFAFSGAPERRTAEGCCGGVRRGYTM
ncbi:predicted protein [Histoplasma capsulatum var. duboisii H88]|uniref:Predicted protein n=1 Tax=Ajellomyces capsulatus (strain H88) TaxID=544711 RepID=F0UN48_AJEC8|nr:predicted protein [Histoplasma capsulatum var. duboisii H88]